MATFSQRHGYTEIQRAFQRESIDEPLRTALWNILSVSMWDRWQHPSDYTGYTSASQQIDGICKRLWFHHFKHDLDTLRPFKGQFNKQGTYDYLKAHFFRCKWYEVYNFLEFLIQDSSTFIDADVIKWINQILEKENAAYRVVGMQIVEITDANEIKAIEAALEHPDAPVRTHIQTALSMLSDRTQPDYRNSIKEAISAVEATCRLVTGAKTATLGDALKNIRELHPALQKAFSALYGFTSDAGGVRHSLLDESNLTYSDAKFMLAACSAFVSYLRATAIHGS